MKPAPSFKSDLRAGAMIVAEVIAKAFAIGALCALLIFGPFLLLIGNITSPAVPALTEDQAPNAEAGHG